MKNELKNNELKNYVITITITVPCYSYADAEQTVEGMMLELSGRGTTKESITITEEV